VLINDDISEHSNYHTAFLTFEVLSLEIVFLGIFIILSYILADALKNGCCIWHREASGKIGVKIVVAWSFMMVMDNMR